MHFHNILDRGERKWRRPKNWRFPRPGKKLPGLSILVADGISEIRRERDKCVEFCRASAIRGVAGTHPRSFGPRVRLSPSIMPAPLLSGLKPVAGLMPNKLP